MRKRLYYLMASVLLLGALSSCEMFDDLINISFDTEYVDIDFTVQPNEAGVHTVTEKVLQSDIKAEIEDHGGDPESIDEIVAADAKLSVLTDGFTLDPFKWVEVYVETADVDKIKIGTANVDKVGMLNVKLAVTETDLRSIINAEEYIVTVVAEYGEAISEPIDMLLEIRYKVTI